MDINAVIAGMLWLDEAGAETQAPRKQRCHI
jgi:hypothetical protein